MKTKMHPNSLEAHEALRNSLQAREKAVFDAIVAIEPATNREIANHLGLEINQITGRTNSLANKKHLIGSFGNKRNPVSGLNNMAYSVSVKGLKYKS